MTTKQRADLTFKDNLTRGRHGWIRMTPAYSVQIVEELIRNQPGTQSILEPFCGTGTTGVVAAQSGLRCDVYDINPFLLWLTRVKCANYSADRIASARDRAHAVIVFARAQHDHAGLWVPPISHIERWWSPSRLTALAKLFGAIEHLLPGSSQEKDLLLVAFCRLLIRWSNAAFNHQSMSFRANEDQPRLFDDEEDDDLYPVFLSDAEAVFATAGDALTGVVQTHRVDARAIAIPDAAQRYDAVITSPPYVNRMSYIRELRPYMYWLGYLNDAREAGEMDWTAIGGTWGIATSRLNDWTPAPYVEPLPRLTPLIDAIAGSSPLLSRYVHKYFEDMSRHFSHVYHAVKPGGRVHYIVGNSKFYDTLVPAEALYGDLMQQHGFEDIRIDILRKRNSKKELFEFLVSATKPSAV